MQNEITQTEETDIAQAIRSLNDDSINPQTKMSAIDMKANLHPIEIPAIMGIDTLVLLKVFPLELLQLTLQKKRLSPSKHGKGREQIVRMTTRQADDEQQRNRYKPSSPMGILKRKREEQQQQ
jgi:hypothetical protein